MHSTPLRRPDNTIPGAEDEFVTLDLLALALEYHIGRVRVPEQLFEVSLQALDTIHCNGVERVVNLGGPLGFVSRFAAVYGFGKPGKSAAAAAVTLTTQGEMCHY